MVSDEGRALRPFPPRSGQTESLRLAGAPISWGVCEVPGWGYQLPRERVLHEMAAVGLAATEFGPAGFLPADPTELAGTLAAHDLLAVGGFVPVVLHDADRDPLPMVSRLLDDFAATGGTVLVLAAATGFDGYDTRPVLDDDQWRTLLSNVDRLAELAVRRGLLAVLHPHVGTVVESARDVRRVLDGAAASLCLDTGHLLIGGSDPVALARDAAERIAHVHLKDVDAALLGELRAGHFSYTEAVRKGLYRPLGQGDARIADVVGHLAGAGYTGWYVLEQDTILSGDPPGDGPVADVRASLEFLAGLATAQ